MNAKILRLSKLLGRHALMLGSALTVSTASAQNTVWTNPGLGTWYIDSNWSEGVPQYWQNAYILQGTALFPGLGSGQSYVLQLGNGNLIITGGRVLTGAGASIGATYGSNSTVTVSGNDSSWFGHYFTVGGDNYSNSGGNGTLRIENGGWVYGNWGRIGAANGTNGTAIVTGANSLWDMRNIIVGGADAPSGYNGAGTLQIADSGRVYTLHIQVYGAGSVHVNNGSSTVAGLTVFGGEVAQDDPWYLPGASPFGPLTVGDTSSARMVIQTGGTVSNSIGTIGANSGTTGSVLLQDANSTWTNSGDVVVGQAGTGTLEVRGGSKLYSLRGHVGFNSGSSGSVIVSDPGSSWTASGSHFIGNGGVGSLQVLNGGVASTAGNSYLAFSAGASGTATVSGAGSIWNTAATLAIGGNLAAAGGSGRLMIGNGGAVNAGAIRLYSTGQIELNNTTTLTGPITSLGGQIRVSSGDAVLSNDITLESGGLTVRTFGNNATFSGNLSGVGGLTKDGGGIGTLTLTGNNTYTGETIVDSGRLVVEGSLSSPVTLENGAVLDGSGTVGPVTIKSGGIVAPGNSPGLLTAGDTRFEGGGAYLLDLRSDGTGAAGTDWDSLAVNGTLDVSEISEANPFIIRLQTLDASNNLNYLDLWDRNISHTWDSVLTTLALGGGDFDARSFEVDTTGFQNPINGTFSVVQDGTNFNLQYDAEVSTTLAGDYNGDGIVDAADYTIWRDTLGSSWRRTGGRRRWKRRN